MKKVCILIIVALLVSSIYVYGEQFMVTDVSDKYNIYYNSTIIEFGENSECGLPILEFKEINKLHFIIK